MLSVEIIISLASFVSVGLIGRIRSEGIACDWRYVLCVLAYVFDLGNEEEQRYCEWQDT